MDQEEVLQLWEKLEIMPLTSQGELRKPFHIWDKGENIQNIYAWFDEHYHGGVEVLLHSYA